MVQRRPIPLPPPHPMASPPTPRLCFPGPLPVVWVMGLFKWVL